MLNQTHNKTRISWQNRPTAFGSVMQTRSFSSVAYRFGFNNQEKDGELGEAYAFEYRIHDARLGRFLSVDPLRSEYPWNSSYAYAENSAIGCIDLEGAEGAVAALGYARLAKAYPRVGLVMSGVLHLAGGTIGAVGSCVYISGTGGTGAAIGGTIALELSVGEMAIGFSQIVDACASDEPNTILQSSSSIPGMIAYGVKSPYAPLWDAGGQFLTGTLTGGNITGMFNSTKMARTATTKGEKAFNALSSIDAGSDIYGMNIFFNPVNYDTKKEPENDLPNNIWNPYQTMNTNSNSTINQVIHDSRNIILPRNTHVLNGNGVRLRNSPSSTSTVIGAGNSGYGLTLTGNAHNGWSEVVLNDNTKAWVSSQYIKEIKSQKTTNSKKE